MIVGAAGPEAAGLGLHASRHVAKGERVYGQRPLVFLQSSWSSHLAPACLHCGALLGGSLRELFRRVIGACGSMELSLQQLEQHGVLDNPGLSLPCGIPCPMASASPPCTAAFCSEECRDAQLSTGHHRMTCGGASEEQRTAWAQFHSHAENHHDTFELAGLVVAQAACDVLHSAATPATVIARYAQFAAEPWHEMLAKHAEDRQTWVDRRKAMLAASHELLSAVLQGSLENAQLGELSTLEGFSRLVGMLDLTTKDLGRQSPLDLPLRAAIARAPTQVHSELAKLGLAWRLFRNAAQDRQAQTSPDTSDDEDEGEAGKVSPGGTMNLVEVSRRAASLPLLPSFDGFGLVEAVALTNHSCSATLDVEAGNGAGPVEAVAVAVRDVAEGEELLMSYIDDDQPRNARRRELLDRYSFQCRCARCVAEAEG